MHNGHLSIYAGDRSPCCQEIVKILNCAFQCNHYYYHYLSGLFSILQIPHKAVLHGVTMAGFSLLSPLPTHPLVFLGEKHTVAEFMT